MSECPVAGHGGRSPHLGGQSGAISRRALFGAGAAAGVGAAAAIGTDLALGGQGGDDATLTAAGTELNGTSTIAFHGEHQAGIEMVPQAFENLVALSLFQGTTKDQLQRLLRILSDDAARMTQGRYALADSEPEFAATPARLTITFGFGPDLVAIARGPEGVPSWLAPLPAFSIDRLEPRWNGGDLLLQVASDDPTTVAHVTRMLLKDTRSFAGVNWFQHGFRSAHGSQPEGTTARNLLGQVDGTVNPVPGSADFDRVVWRDDTTGPADEDWLVGGTTMVVRRIEMLLDKWDRLDRTGREETVGRRLDDGAPLTGTNEHDDPDFDATTPVGFPVIAEFSHIRRARGDAKGDSKLQMFRRGYNYELGPTDIAVSDAGHIFTAFQADLMTQFVPMQQRLADLDLLNEWTSPIGSAVFAIPPGAPEGGFVGQTLFD